MNLRLMKHMCAALLVCELSVPAMAAQPSPVDLTGEHWKLSSDSEKQAFLYGASNIVAIEQLVSEKTGAAPSPFVSAWIRAFGGTSWKDMQKQLDDWYASHPSESSRPVFDVLWYEFMVPAGR